MLEANRPRTQPAEETFDTVINLIVTVLTPMFLAVTDGKVNQARAAAAHTLTLHCSETHSDLLVIAQIIAFGLAAVDSISLSLTEDLPIPMILRLQNCAQRSSRIAEMLRQPPRPQRQTAPRAPAAANPPARPDIRQAKATLAAVTGNAPAADQSTAPADPVPDTVTPAGDPRGQHAWANALAGAAAELTADIANLPPEERREAKRCAASFNAAASRLLATDPTIARAVSA